MAARFVEPRPAAGEPWTFGDLRCHWAEVVGDELAAICKPFALDERGKLSVLFSEYAPILAVVQITQCVPRIVEGRPVHCIQSLIERAGVDDEGEQWKE